MLAALASLSLPHVISAQALHESTGQPPGSIKLGYEPSKDPALVRQGDQSYGILEEAALSSGLSRPFLEGPASIAALWNAADMILQADPGLADSLMNDLSLLFPAPRGMVDYALSLDATGGYDQEPAATLLGTTRPYFINPQDMDRALDKPPLLDTRFLFRNGPLAIDLNPELRPASHIFWENTGYWTNGAALYLPGEIDANIPYRGIGSITLQDFEFRLGRDKLQLGPGRRSSLGIGYSLPWVDYASAKAHFGTVDISWYLIRLDPRISDDEETYILSVQSLDPATPQLEDNASYNGLQGTEKAKHLVASRLTWRPFGWLAMALTQHHLVGGRMLQLSDANPFILFHNLFQEGIYSVPATAEFSIVPTRGIEVYGQYMLYDATVADEVGGDTGNAGASAWQFGTTFLSNPWIDLGPGRLRLDMELNKADPWMYGKYIAWRQFTSRYVFVESSSGRYWADYPIGFYLGPDAWELWGCLSYGKPGSWDIKLEAAHSVRGSIDVNGFGPDNDYANKDDFVDEGWVMVRPDEVAEKRTRMSISFDMKPGNGKAPGRNGLSGSLGAGLTVVDGYGFKPGAIETVFDVSIAVGWSL